MVRGTYVFLLLILSGCMLFSFSSSNTKKLLSRTRWDINTSIDSLIIGDTIIFARAKDKGELYFKSNGVLQERIWYLYCGNKFFLDRFMSKPREWENIGRWNVSEADGKSTLNLELETKTFSLNCITQSKDSMIFVTQTVSKK